MSNRIEKLQAAASWTLFCPSSDNDFVTYATCKVYDMSGNPVAVVEFEYADGGFSYAINPVVKFCDKFYWIRKAGFSAYMSSGIKVESGEDLSIMDCIKFVHDEINNLRICWSESKKSWTIRLDRNFEVGSDSLSFSINTSANYSREGERIMSMKYINEGCEEEKEIMLNFFQQKIKVHDRIPRRYISAWFNDTKRKTSVHIEEI